MARGELLVSLVRAGVSGDESTVRSTAEALVADERAKNHHVLASRLERALASVKLSPPADNKRLNRPADGRDTILEIEPQLRLEDLLLTLPVQEAGKQLVNEQNRSDILRSHGLEPRHRVLLSGPPGNGKTSFAEAIASELCLPLFMVRYDSLVGSYLGETNSRLRALFDYVRTRPCVLFFDEFDSIGKERGDDHEAGEIKRVVSFLLLQLDQLPSYVTVIAATNHGELLDRAVWRRFQLRLDFPAPTKKLMTEYIRNRIAQWPVAPKKAITKIVDGLMPLSFAEAADFCQNVRRREVLSLGELSVDKSLESELALWRSRVTPEKLNAERSRQASSEAGSPET